MLGDCTKNKWCCFCANWYDPANSALKPRTGRNLFDVDNTAMSKCMATNLKTKALFTCPKFKPKL